MKHSDLKDGKTKENSGRTKITKDYEIAHEHVQKWCKKNKVVIRVIHVVLHFDPPNQGMKPMAKHPDAPTKCVLFDLFEAHPSFFFKLAHPVFLICLKSNPVPIHVSSIFI